MNRRVVVICSNCRQPTYFEFERGASCVQIPGALPCRRIEHLPEDIDELYKQARVCHANGAYTAVVLLARKLLMHIAINLGARPGQNFVSYVEHLADKNVAPGELKALLSEIRKQGNQSNHQITVEDRASAIRLLKFLEGVLVFAYEYPKELELGSEKSGSSPSDSA